MQKNLYLKTTKEVFRKYNSSKDGLTAVQAKDRLLTYGPNSFEKVKQYRLFKILFKQIKSPFVIILIVAGIISFLLGEYIDSLVILFSMFLNVLIGFFQEYKASKAFEHINKQISQMATVVRGGELHRIDSRYLVPGDIVILKYGDKVPADIRIFEATKLEVDESILTGEYLPQAKNSKTLPKPVPLGDRTNTLFMGTSIVSGGCRGIVTGTGKETEFGKIAELILQDKQEKPFLQLEINKLVNTLLPVLLLLISVLFAIGLIQGESFNAMFIESVALAVAAIPESLPVAVTVIFAIGMKKMADKKGLVKKLMATETLGRTEVLCIDKTGTLTKGKMAVIQVITPNTELEVEDINRKSISSAIEEIGFISTTNNEAFKEEDNYVGNPTDIALLRLANTLGFSKEKIYKEVSLIEFIPFDSKFKYSNYLVKVGKVYRQNVIGAPEVVLGRCSKIRADDKSLKSHNLDSIDRDKFLEKTNKLAGKGYRILALATRHIENPSRNQEVENLTFVGLIVLSDPLRESAKETVARAQESGIKIVIVTGDHPEIAKTIAHNVGLPSSNKNVITGQELSVMSDTELDGKIQEISIFARLSPTDKVRIVNSWKRLGKVVGMTGDGVNDAPALNLADIGIALGSGSDITKEAADLILLDDNLETILEAVYEGRGILDNIKKVVTYLLSDSFAEITIVGFSILLGYPLAILPAQILWINFIEDGLPGIALAFEKTERSVRKLNPGVYKRAILDKEVKVIAFLIGFLDDIALISLFIFFYHSGYDIGYIRTVIFIALSLDSLFFVYSCKSLRTPIWKIDILSNKFLNISVLVGVIAIFSAIYFPPFQTILSTHQLSLPIWILLIAISLIEVILLEITKWIFEKKGFWR